MKSSHAVLALLSLLIFASSTIESRKIQAGEYYWGVVMKDQPMPKAIQGLIVVAANNKGPDSKPIKSSNIPNCRESDDHHHDHDHNHDHLSKYFTDDFEPTPNATAYPDGEANEKLSSESVRADVTSAHHEKPSLFTQDFEPIPHATVYNE